MSTKKYLGALALLAACELKQAPVSHTPAAQVAVEIVAPEAPSVHEVMSFVAQSITHGERHQALSNGTIEGLIAHGETVAVTCGRISAYAAYELSKYGYQNRDARAETLEAKNGYDDGHVMREVLVDGSWVVYDLDNNVQPLKDGRGIPLATWIELIAAGEDYELRQIADDQAFDAEFLEHYPEFATDWDIRAWYARVLQVETSIQ
jgi:hypothetical protein